ncbi:hypothetical protein OZX74_02855 [Bifidobacterium sp. ESL0798]|uniref:hypothetical protein n=1 Tax=Bifidobacterium sp. ESL0798 TaxID=2983235 RepID=UPI0023F83326|nr:hypothetical protein [Bifidobacterium sp. ESL0798]WEV74492.1 hypothetical protein OZX74_02855 [Bifidobacterium sp. ESL0798]
MTTGEQIHELGEMGAYWAKRWLDKTTRAQVTWVNPSSLPTQLTFPWKKKYKNKSPDFSFDLGGLLCGDGDEGESKKGQQFVAECKRYSSGRDQNSQFTEFLAKCYCARIEAPRSTHVFLWITWSAFGVTNWSKLHSSESIQKALIKYREQALGVSDEAMAQKVLDTSENQKIIKDLSKNIWVIVLSDEQIKYLSLSEEDKALIIGNRAKESK